MNPKINHIMKVGLFGLGAIGRELAHRLDQGVDGLQLIGASARDQAKAAQYISALSRPVAVMGAQELAEAADIIVECAPVAVFPVIADAAIKRGKIFVPLSVGGLLKMPELAEQARQHGARIVVPTGALLGLDAVRAAAEGEIYSVTMVTRKPPAGLAGAPYLINNAINIDHLTEAKMVFKGTARDGVAAFPANVNVVAALSLAGIGADRTTMEIWADPALSRNTHRIKVDSDSARFELFIENIPTPGNAPTGKITALSTLSCLRGMVSHLKIGS